jgi:hypothetical protein
MGSIPTRQPNGHANAKNSHLLIQPPRYRIAYIGLIAADKPDRLFKGIRPLRLDLVRPVLL